jgi:hypothetical protein
MHTKNYYLAFVYVKTIRYFDSRLVLSLYPLKPVNPDRMNVCYAFITPVDTTATRSILRVSISNSFQQDFVNDIMAQCVYAVPNKGHDKF